jgi:hypothetical protein
MVVAPNPMVVANEKQKISRFQHVNYLSRDLPNPSTSNPLLSGQVLSKVYRRETINTKICAIPETQKKQKEKNVETKL